MKDRDEISILGPLGRSGPGKGDTGPEPGDRPRRDLQPLEGPEEPWRREPDHRPHRTGHDGGRRQLPGLG